MRIEINNQQSLRRPGKQNLRRLIQFLMSKVNQHAPDIIWNEVLLAAKSKPTVVSMGDVAASGGYFVACAADTIVANATTITGSIGVFGILLYMEKFFDHKLGVTFDRVNTGQFSDFGNGTRRLSEAEKAIIQSEVDHIYDVFVRRVAEGRGSTYEKIDELAQGRVWTGAQAAR